MQNIGHRDDYAKTRLFEMIMQNLGMIMQFATDKATFTAVPQAWTLFIRQDLSQLKVIFLDPLLYLTTG